MQSLPQARQPRRSQRGAGPLHAQWESGASEEILRDKTLQVTKGKTRLQPSPSQASLPRGKPRGGSSCLDAEVLHPSNSDPNRDILLGPRRLHEVCGLEVGPVRPKGAATAGASIPARTHGARSLGPDHTQHACRFPVHTHKVCSHTLIPLFFLFNHLQHGARKLETPEK